MRQLAVLLSRATLVAAVGLLHMPTRAPAQVYSEQETMRSLAFVHASIVDVRAGSIRQDMTVISNGRHIVVIGASRETSVPASARVVDGTGYYLVPGFWDMHVHIGGNAVARSVDFPLYTAMGIVGVRDMWGDCTHDCGAAGSVDEIPTIDVVRSWRTDEAGHKLSGPRVIASSSIMDGPEPIWPQSIALHNPTEGREAVRAAKRRGVDFVKVYSRLPRDTYLAVADEAKRLGLPFAGHVPNAVQPAEASDVGQRSMEHLLRIPNACTNRQPQLDSLETRRPKSLGTPAGGAWRRAYTHALLTSYDTSICRTLFEKFVQNHTWQVPTLVVWEGGLHFENPRGANDSLLRYVPPEVGGTWTAPPDWRGLRTREDFELEHQFMDLRLKIVGEMNKAGVGILAGTDVGNPWVYPGFSLHRELELLVQAGLSPAAALRTATISPAEFLGATDSLGTIAEGKLADFVVLEGNPLEDIRQTSRIVAVVRDGHLVDSVSRNRMLTAVQRAAARVYRAPSAKDH
jgi:hypothetical protein